jgi:hypothetical protein
MANYKCIASRPEDRQLLQDALAAELGDTHPLLRKVHTVHAHAQARAAPAVDHGPLLVHLAHLAETSPSMAQSIAVAVDALNKETRTDATYRRQKGIVTLNMTRQDCDDARHALKAYARTRPAMAESCRLLYRRLAPS